LSVVLTSPGHMIDFQRARSRRNWKAIMNDFRDLPPQHTSSPFQQKRPRSTWFWLLVLTPLALLLVVVAIIGVGAIFVMTSKEEPITPSERQMIVDIDALAQCMEGFAPDPQYESITKTKYVDSSYDIEYEYSPPDESDDPFLYCCVTVERKLSDAVAAYGIAWQTCKMMTWGSDVEVEYVDHNEIFTWGDSSRFAIIEAGGDPVGNLFVARRGKTVVEVMVIGVYFDANEHFAAFVSSKLDSISRQLP
jgi:hypothetical protein